MIASTQYRLTASDLETVLAMVRAATLAGAAQRLTQDASTVFRVIRRIERGIGQRLFERSRSGYTPTELARQLAANAEQVEAQLELARCAAQSVPQAVAGTVRITTTDSVLHGLVGPALRSLSALHPLLQFDLHTGNELANLTWRDADIAVRATKRPPPHLVGKRLGAIRVALFAPRRGPLRRLAQAGAGKVPWIAPDEALPEHPSVLWRKRHLPRVTPACRVTSILTVLELVAQGLGVGILPLFLVQGRRDLVALGAPLDEAQTDLWLLTHAQSRHLTRVSTVYAHLAANVALTDTSA